MHPAASSTPQTQARPQSAAAGEQGRTRTLLAAGTVTVALTGCADLSAGALLAAVAIAQVALVFSWVLGTGMPGRIGALVIGVAGAAAADVSVVVWPHSALSPLLAPLGLGVLALFIHQLVRGVVRARVVESVSATTVVLVTVIALSAYVQLRHEDDGPTMAVAAVVSAGAGLFAAQLIDLVWSHPRFDPEVPHGLVGVVGGSAAGAGIGLWALYDSTAVTRLHAGLVCTAVAALAALLGVGTGFVAHRLAVDASGTETADPAQSTEGSRDEFGIHVRPFPTLRPFATAIIPLALTAPAAYVLFLSVG